MTTIIIGDQGEGSKHWGIVDFRKRDLARRHALTNPNMNEWIDLGNGSKAHIRLINGVPHAEIHSGLEGYIFYVPLTFDTDDLFVPFLTKGEHFLEGILSGANAELLFSEFQAAFNTTHLITGFTPSISLCRNSSIFTLLNPQNPQGADLGVLFTSLSQPRHFFSVTSSIGRDTPLLSASSKVGKYILGFDLVPFGGATSSGNIVSRVLVIDTTLPAGSDVVYSAAITGNWPDDSIYGTPTTMGNWSFDRSGKKACANFWVADFHRFRAYGWNYVQPFLGASNPEPDFCSSYVIELEFIFDSEGEFIEVVATQVLETPDFCIAADYDYTSPGNEIITAQLYGFDYRVDKAYTWAPGISARPSPASGQFQMGDHIRVIAPAKLGNLTKSRMLGLYEIVGVVYPSTPEATATGQLVWSSGATGIAVGQVYTVTESPAPTPPLVPFVHFYRVSAIPDDPTVPVFGVTAPTHTTGSATNGNVTLDAIVPTLGPDRSLTAIEWTASTGGWSVGSTIKVTVPGSFPGGFFSAPTVRYYNVSSIGSPPNLTGSTPPIFAFGSGTNGDLTLTVVTESFPTHHKGDVVNGNILLRNRTQGLAEEWRPNISGTNEIPKNSLFKVSEAVPPIPPNRRFKTDGSERSVKFYEAISWPDMTAPFFGSTPPTHTSGTAVNGNVTLLATTDHKSAADIFLHLRYMNGTTIQSLELAHNIDYETNTSSAGTWYERTVGGSSSFATNLTGLDLRVKGATAYSNTNASNWASMYDREWTNGVELPISAITSLPPANIYMARLLYQRIKRERFRNTIAAIPYLSTPEGDIIDACIYAPYVTDLGKPTEFTDPDKTIDFRIDKINDEHNIPDWRNIPDTDILTGEKIGFTKDYHRNIFQAKFPDVTPIWNRFMIAGAWLKKRQRD